MASDPNDDWNWEVELVRSPEWREQLIAELDGRAIGAIRVGPTYSIVEVSASVAEAFERATKDRDPRDPRVMIRRWNEGPLPPEAARKHQGKGRGEAPPKRRRS